MDAHTYAMSNAYKNYLEAANAVLAKYQSEGGRQKESINLALVQLSEKSQYFLAASESADNFILEMNRRRQRQEVFEEAHKKVALEMGLENLHHMHGLLTSSYHTFASCFALMADQAIKLNSEAPVIFLDELFEAGNGEMAAEPEEKGDHEAADPTAAGTEEAADPTAAGTEEVADPTAAATEEAADPNAAATEEAAGPTTAATEEAAGPTMAATEETSGPSRAATEETAHASTAAHSPDR